MERWQRGLASLMLGSRWVQLPIYVGLVLASALYTWKFLLVLADLVLRLPSLGPDELMIGVLTLVDISLVANLLAMTTIGGYATFVTRAHIESHHARPEWLETIDASALKTKLLGSLVGISGVRLLETFLDVGKQSERVIFWQVVLHVVFVVSTLAMMWVGKVSHAVPRRGAS
jgi:uncharacterized protein (TIGR00645 family)